MVAGTWSHRSDKDEPAGAGRLLALLRVLFAFPALALLASAPLPAATPDLHLVPMCTAEGPRLVRVEGEDPLRPRQDHDHGQMACAHALCPREILPGRKA